MFFPFGRLRLVLGIVFLGIIAIVVASGFFSFFSLALGHAVFLAPHLAVPFFSFGFGFVFFGIILLALIASFFFFFFFFFRPYRRRMYYGRWYGHNSAMDSLRERYARGEINREQFQQMTADLERHR